MVSLTPFFQKREIAAEEGWKEIKLNDKAVRTSYEPRAFNSHHLAQVNVDKKAGRAHLFNLFLPPSFVTEWLDEVKENYPNAFIKRRRKRKSTNIVTTIAHVYQMLAYRIFIYGRQKRPQENRRDEKAIINAFQAARKHCGGDNLLGSDRARRLNTYMCLRVDHWHQTDLVDNFQSVLLSCGEVLVCDEKVFDFDSANAGWVRVIPAKKQVGLWNYTACVWLSGELLTVCF